MNTTLSAEENIITILTSDGYYLAFDNLKFASYAIADLPDSDEIIIQEIPSKEMALRYLQAHHIYRQIYYHTIPQINLSYLPLMESLPYGVKGANVPQKERIVSNKTQFFYEIRLIDNKYFLLSALNDVINLISNLSNVPYIYIKRQYDKNICIQHIQAYDAAIQILNGQNLSLINPPLKTEGDWGTQGTSLNKDIFSNQQTLININY